MKIIVTLFFLLITTAAAFAQIENPVSWSFSAKKLTANSYELHLKATMQPGWHVYAQEAGNVPQPTAFAFTANPLLKLDGTVQESGSLQKVYDNNIKGILKYYSSSVDFIQKLIKKAAVNTLAKGMVTYVVCNDRKCLPTKTEGFSVKL